MRQIFFYIFGLTSLIACQNNSSGDRQISGADIYKTRCVTCHGMDGAMGNNGAKNLIVSEMPINDRLKVIRNGKGGIMPAFKTLLSQEEILAVAQYSLRFNPTITKE